VLDLRADLGHAADLGGSTEASVLVVLDETLGALSRPELDKVASPALHAKREAAVAALVARRALLTDKASVLRTTYQATEKALDAAALCKGKDLRAPGLPAGATRGERDQAELAAPTEQRKAATKRDLALFESPACADATRLWSSLRSLDVTSKSSTATVAAHLRELDFTGERAALRDKVRGALEEHSKALAAFDAAAKTGSDVTLASAMGELGQELDRAATTCLSGMKEPASEIQGGNDNAREIVLLVQPKWPDRFGEDAPQMGVFGTGFLVRWRTSDGSVEARIVTNAHVMSGAPEAWVVTNEGLRSTDPDALRLKGAAAKADSKEHWHATVLRTSEDDDIAVLRVDPHAPGMPRTGMAFRLAPPSEQEPVVAAGFPGIGGQPAFQISRGSVSNAELGTSQHPFSMYIQHTAPIDPGNSGGPLIDGSARLLGVNTFKVRNRESVGIAIPTARVQLALMRAGDHRSPTPKHAEATCNALVSAFSAYAPSRGAVDRVSLGLYDPAQRTMDARTNAYRERVQGEPESPAADYRAKAYARLRAAIEDAGGVPRMTECSDVTATAAGYTASFRTRTSTTTLTLKEEEDGALRLVAVH
jgi:S1-C subfamily serine protease